MSRPVDGLGLEELRRRTPPGVCPFCGSPAAVKRSSSAKLALTCGDEVCLVAYWRLDKRDRRARLRGAAEVRR